MFGSDSSKNTKFGPEVDNTIWFTFSPDGAAILAKYNMAAILLDVNHRYKNVKGYPHKWYMVLGFFMVGEFN